MVRIAIAGGSGQVAREVIDAIVATKKHEVTILSRNQSSQVQNESSVLWRAVDYTDKANLVVALQGIHTVLSFVQLLSDTENTSQKNLIDASIEAGVKRFAPSEWANAEVADMPWWSGKQEIRNYLKEVNQNGKVLEYTLFQPGLFLDYLAFPYKTAKYVEPLGTMIDFQNRRAIVVDDHDYIMALTAVRDVAEVVAQAVGYDGEWPLVGGIRGGSFHISEIIKIGEKIRGPFTVEKVKLEDLEAGILKASWKLEAKHHSVSDDKAPEMLATVLKGLLLSGAKNAWDSSDEFNRILTDVKFTNIEDFLTSVWKGKP